MNCAPMVPRWFWMSSSNIAEIPAIECTIMYLPTSPFALASPFGCLSVVELSSTREFCPDHAASTMTLASWTCLCFFSS